VSLCDALRVRPNDIVCFVGAGGKTTATMQIAMELAGREQRVLVTTTTKIFEPVTTPGEVLLLADTLDVALEQLPHRFDAAPVVMLAQKRLDSEILDTRWMGRDYPVAVHPRKLKGIPPEWVDILRDQSGADVIVIEADGAAHRMLKAPNLREPVIPGCTTLVVPMADMNVLGKALSDEFVHRPALLADLAGIPLGYPISPEVLAIALGHPNGGLKDVPPNARVIPLLTVHNASSRSTATEKAIRMLLLSPRIDHVVLAQLRSTPIRWEIYTR